MRRRATLLRDGRRGGCAGGIAALSSALSATAITTTAVATDRVRLEYPVATFTPTQPGYFGLPLFGGDDIRFGLGG